MTWIVARRCLLVVGLVAVVAVGLSLDLGEVLRWLSGSAGWVHAHGAVGVAAFLAAFIVWGLVLPKGPFVLLAGFVFGFGQGLLVTYAAATAVIAAAFWIARLAGRPHAAGWLARRPWLAACDRALDHQAARIIVLLRMSPLIPSQVQNYLYGLSRVRFGTCMVASWLGMLPFTAVWVAVGATAGSAGGAGVIEERLWWTMPTGIVAGVIALGLVAWQARRTLRAAGVVAGPATTVVLRDVA